MPISTDSGSQVQLRGVSSLVTEGTALAAVCLRSQDKQMSNVDSAGQSIVHPWQYKKAERVENKHQYLLELHWACAYR